MGPNTPSPDREARFAALYNTAYSDVLRFVRRRAAADSAEDLVHESFLVVWRRMDDVPHDHDSARAWLFGIARNCMLNAQRGDIRRNELNVRITADLAIAGDPAEIESTLRLGLAAAWPRLSASEQEVLSLAIWEDLPSQHAGKVLGISASAYRIRLHRARAALRRLIDTTPHPVIAGERLATEQTI